MKTHQQVVGSDFCHKSKIAEALSNYQGGVFPTLGTATATGVQKQLNTQRARVLFTTSPVFEYYMLLWDLRNQASHQALICFCTQSRTAWQMVCGKHEQMRD
jgi:hypothetical protein